MVSNVLVFIGGAINKYHGLNGLNNRKLPLVSGEASPRSCLERSGASGDSERRMFL